MKTGRAPRALRRARPPHPAQPRILLHRRRQPLSFGRRGAALARRLPAGAVGGSGLARFALREPGARAGGQVLPDGANWESSTGCHRALRHRRSSSTFLLSARERRPSRERQWRRVRSMLEYMRAYLRPDRARAARRRHRQRSVLTAARRGAGGHAYLLRRRGPFSTSRVSSHGRRA